MSKEPMLSSGFLQEPHGQASGVQAFRLLPLGLPRGRGDHWVTENADSGAGSKLCIELQTLVLNLSTLSLPPRILLLDPLRVHFKHHFLKTYEEKLFINVGEVLLIYTSTSQSFRISFCVVFS